MNLVTMTFDADEWQVVPKKATAEMRDGLRTGSRRDVPSDELCNVRWASALGKAPQPPAVSAEPVAWQSIETAPKDGTVVLVCQETEPGFWEFEQAWWSPTWGFGGGNCTNKPTHWMPLPSPPSNADMQKGGA